MLASVSVWLMDPPEPPEAPLMEPVIVPKVHEYELAMLEVNVTPVPVPLQIVSELLFVIAGAGLTVTVMVVLLPTHEPVLEVGTTI